jgi:glycerol kinase
MDARGLFIGMTQHTVRGHLLRAILEGIAFRTAEVIGAVERDLGQKVKEISVDGGMAANPFFLRLQADISGNTLLVPDSRELTSKGAARVAMIGRREAWADAKETEQPRKVQPNVPNTEQWHAMWAQWQAAVSRSFNWVK